MNRLSQKVEFAANALIIIAAGLLVGVIAEKYFVSAQIDRRFFNSVEESAAHLSVLGLDGIEVRRSPLDVIQVSGTPTLILTNEEGEVRDFWVGKLTPDKEMEVINKLNS